MKQKRWFRYLFSANEHRDLLFLRCVFIAVPLIVLWVAFATGWPEAAARIYPGCPIYRITGLYCPGCGGTHAFRAMAHGEIGASLSFHPLVLPAACFIVLYLAALLLWKLCGGRGFKPHFRRVYIVISIGLILYHVISANVSSGLGYPLY